MPEPQISLVLSCSSVTAQVRSMLEHVVETQPAGRIELILVAWEGLDYEALAKGFHSVRTLHFHRDTGLNTALTRAIVEATAPIVVFLEDHVRVRGDWVPGLVRIFTEQKCAAVGWTTLPGDLDSNVSWAGYLAEYGLWGPGVREGQARDHLPGHNTAYDRATLLEYHHVLDNLMRAESLLHWRLLEDGRKLYFTTDFVLRHRQFRLARNLYIANFWYGWNFGDARQIARNWGPVQRAIYAGAIILKPWVRWKTLLRTPRTGPEYPRGVLARTWPMISLAFAAGAIGEAFGYVFGAWRAPARLTEYELGYDRSES
jgi:hypothetical protein